jgi:tetratricopeptide (TPR) repeat protein
MRHRPVSASAAAALLAAALLGAAGCAEYQPFDSAAHLRGLYAERVEREDARAIEVPFELDAAIRTLLEQKHKPAPNELRRVEQVLDFIFRGLDLRYSLTPTRNAVETYQAREGNCLSFVNLFVGVARHQRLAPFYVEVTDYQRWNYKEGLVVSRGHIVAGLYLRGKLQTYDFLPYRPKAYKDFKPIDDLTAAAHYYNNLGAEALMAGDLDRALALLATAHRIAPDFVKAANNLGVAYARRGEIERAVEIYRRGLAGEPKDVALLTNLARAYQQLGRHDEATAAMAQIEGANTTNPYFYVYQAELALARGDLAAALDDLTEALRQDSELPEVHLGLVKVYLEAGDLERARHHLSRALRLDATNPEARRFADLLAGASDAGKP